MKVAIIFVLFFATVFCRPARKFYSSSSESSEEVVRSAGPAPVNREAAVLDSAIEITQTLKAALDRALADSTDAASDWDTASDPDAASDPDTASVDPTARIDNEDIDEYETDESDEDKDEDNTTESDESGESSSPAPPTTSPVTAEPTLEPTQEPILPTVVIDEGRGDSLGGGYYYGGGEHPSDYKKSVIYHDDYSVHKVPSPYKSYDTLGMAEGKKMAAYGGADGNEVEKMPKVYKALQVHTDFLEEDTSTPEVDTQGLDTSFGTSLDQEHRQASLPAEEEQVPDEEEEGEEEESASSSDSTTKNESSSASDATDSTSESASASEEGDEEESQSSEETTATPGAADSNSDESEEGDSAESEEAGEGAAVDPKVVTDVHVVIAAK